MCKAPKVNAKPKTKKHTPGFYIKYTSVLTGNPCVMIVTRITGNTKTGPGWQVWYMREDISPMDAVKDGSDRAVCGSCPRRHFLGGDCYLVVIFAPTNVWKAYKEGKYKEYDDLSRYDINFLRAFPYLRLGAYGDSLSGPWSMTQKVIDLIQPGVVTGYTHQAFFTKDPLVAEAKKYLVASVDDIYHEMQAEKEGWSSYMATPFLHKQKMTYPTIVCPYTASEGSVMCSSCGKCNGLKGVVHIRTEEHGARSTSKKKRLYDEPAQAAFAA